MTPLSRSGQLEPVNTDNQPGLSPSVITASASCPNESALPQLHGFNATASDLEQKQTKQYHELLALALVVPRAEILRALVAFDFFSTVFYQLSISIDKDKLSSTTRLYNTELDRAFGLLSYIHLTRDSRCHKVCSSGVSLLVTVAERPCFTRLASDRHWSSARQDACEWSIAQRLPLQAKRNLCYALFSG